MRRSVIQTLDYQSIEVRNSSDSEDRGITNAGGGGGGGGGGGCFNLTAGVGCTQIITTRSTVLSVSVNLRQADIIIPANRSQICELPLCIKGLPRDIDYASAFHNSSVTERFGEYWVT